MFVAECALKCLELFSSRNDNGDNENPNPVENQQTATTMKVSKMLQTDTFPQKETASEASHSSTVDYEAHQVNSEPENANLKELESIIIHLEEENR